MNLDYFTIIIILFIMLVSYRIYINSDIFQLKCIVSEVDGEKYCVRERDKLKLAANRLALVNNNMKKIVEYCSEKYPDNDFVKRLKKGYNPKKYLRYCLLVNIPHIVKIKEKNWPFV